MASAFVPRPAAAATAASSASFSHTTAMLIRHRRPSVTAMASAFNVREENDSVASDKHVNRRYTWMNEDPQRFWETQEPLRRRQAPWTESEEQKDGMEPESSGGSAEEEEAADMRLTAELRLLAVVAADRAEMHGILAVQRDNWNKLFQNTVRSGCATSCVLAAMGAAAGSAAPSTPAAMLCVCTAAIMALVNHFQPSQLAEEQRTAARLFKALVKDVENFSLRVSPRLLPPKTLLLRNARRRLAALDAAFPMPLTPGGLEKFPSKIRPTVLRTPPPIAAAAISPPPLTSDTTTQLTSDTAAMSPPPLTFDANDSELLRIADLLHSADIPKYTGWAQNLVLANKCLAFAAPLMALAAAAVNSGIAAHLAAADAGAGVAAACISLFASFLSSCSHDLQMGMVVEMYRNSAGYYADMEQSIREWVAAAEEERGDEELFRQKVAYKLGRSPADAVLVAADDTMAGTLF